jgi:hypothetical protein
VLVNPYMVVANHSTHFVRDNLSGMLVDFKLKISLHFESSFFLTIALQALLDRLTGCNSYTEAVLCDKFLTESGRKLYNDRRATELKEKLG